MSRRPIGHQVSHNPPEREPPGPVETVRLRYDKGTDCLLAGRRGGRGIDERRTKPLGRVDAAFFRNPKVYVFSRKVTLASWRMREKETSGKEGRRKDWVCRWRSNGGGVYRKTIALVTREGVKKSLAEGVILPWSKGVQKSLKFLSRGGSYFHGSQWDGKGVDQKPWTTR